MCTRSRSSTHPYSATLYSPVPACRGGRRAPARVHGILDCASSSDHGETGLHVWRVDPELHGDTHTVAFRATILPLTELRGTVAPDVGPTCSLTPPHFKTPCPTFRPTSANELRPRGRPPGDRKRMQAGRLPILKTSYHYPRQERRWPSDRLLQISWLKRRDTDS